MQKAIVIVGCFDTKGEDFAFLRSCIVGQDERVIAVNTGVYATEPDFPIDFAADQVAAVAGHVLQTLQQTADRGHAVAVMGRGAAQILTQLHQAGRVKAVIGMGGGGGTYMALAAMQAIPLGVPKLCVSTVATKDLSRQVGSKDITLMPSVVDVAGLNSISRPLIRPAAAAIVAMANIQDSAADDPAVAGAGRIAISMFGNTTACVTVCSDLLKGRGYEVFVFHANGAGGQTMESLIHEGCFDGVLDLTTTELADELCGGICSAGPNRLEAAVVCGIPLVVAPGCLDMVNFAHSDTVPERYRQRTLYPWAPDVTLMRTDEAESAELGRLLAGKLNAAKSPTAILLPLHGLSQLDSAGSAFHHAEANRALFDAIRDTAYPGLTVVEVDAHINDRRFAEVAVATLLQLMERV